MSVTGLILAAAFTGLMLLVHPVPAFAGPRVIIRHATDLDKNKRMRELGASYMALTGARIIYDKCADKLGITEDKKAYLIQKHTKVTKDYQNAYQQEYIDQVNAPPSAAFLEDVTQSILAKQQKVVNDMALVIRENGCRRTPFRQVLEYVDALKERDDQKLKPSTATVADPFAPLPQ